MDYNNNGGPGSLQPSLSGLNPYGNSPMLGSNNGQIGGSASMGGGLN